MDGYSLKKSPHNSAADGGVDTSHLLVYPGGPHPFVSCLHLSFSISALADHRKVVSDCNNPVTAF